LIASGSGYSRPEVVLDEFYLLGGRLPRLGAAGSSSSDRSAEVSGEVSIVGPESGLLIIRPVGEEVVMFIAVEGFEPEVGLTRRGPSEVRRRMFDLAERGDHRLGGLVEDRVRHQVERIERVPTEETTEGLGVVRKEILDRGKKGEGAAVREGAKRLLKEEVVAVVLTVSGIETVGVLIAAIIGEVVVVDVRRVREDVVDAFVDRRREEVCLVDFEGGVRMCLPELGDELWIDLVRDALRGIVVEF